MQFSELYKEGINYWPNEISLEQPSPRMFASLSAAWDEVESSYAKENDWAGLITWAIFSGLHKLALERSAVGAITMRSEDIDLNYVEKALSEGLFASHEDSPEIEGYTNEMKAKYVNDLRKI